MKIIQVAGLANTGKTTFIANLIPVLRSQGKVGVVKHLGDHDFALEEGKDTTTFFENGADISAGVDSKKSVTVFRSTDIDEILLIFKRSGIDFAIIEGFKTRNFTKIIIGDYQDGPCILSNPSPEEVLSSLSQFEDY